MKSPQSRLPLVVGLGWFATAAIAFCIGRIGAPTVGNREASHEAERAAGDVRSTGDVAGTTNIGGTKGQFAMGEGDGSLTVARITNGQPLEKWFKNLMEQQDSIVRMNGLLRLLDAVRDPEELKIALGAINLRGDRGFGRGARFTEYSMILEKFTQLDPKGAIAFVNSKGREEKWIGTSTVMQTWTRTDPAGAIAWAQTSGKEKEDPQGGPGGPGGGPPGFTSSPISIINWSVRNAPWLATCAGSLLALAPARRSTAAA